MSHWFVVTMSVECALGYVGVFVLAGWILASEVRRELRRRRAFG
jgi:hypothetical protein